MASSRELVVETIVDDKNPTKLMSATDEPRLQRRTCRRSPREYRRRERAALAEAVKKSGLPPQAFDRMETWAAAFILLGNSSGNSGFRAGVEGVLRSISRRRARGSASWKPTSSSWLSSTRFQRRHSAQLLEGAIEETEDMEALLRRDARSHGRAATSRHRPHLRPRSVELARAAKGADPPAQRQLEQMDRAAHGATRRGDDRRRRGPSRRQRIRWSSCSRRAATRSARLQ